MIASPDPGSYTLYSTEMLLGFQIQVGKRYCGKQFVDKSYDGACIVPYARHYKLRFVYFLPHFQKPFLCF